MHTVVETRTFHSKACKSWTATEYEDFVLYIAQHPFAGEVIPESGGVRKIRWSKRGSGKRGGVRVIYFIVDSAELWLLTIYAKNERAMIPAHELRKIKEVISGSKNK